MIRPYMPRPYGDDSIESNFNILSHIHIKEAKPE